ncbi:hypothetical protein BC936DRAFT_142460 [Jimgerdemannia flammicorona]|uniref:CHHC U11-48K-type domain-containing protein n=1 Tax=Jimgerdemannia flammicorona TaxID=994334 RepID=A0A433A0B5_9FUNG|nr:hypothetical protein BC936DRAFT_142460 [Jimgerdemannia flammicorona]
MSELNEEELRERPNDVRKLRSSADALKSQLDSILNVLKMTPDELEQTHNVHVAATIYMFNGSELLRTCPFNSLHRVPKESFDAHFKTCQLAYYGIKSERKPKLPSSMFFYLNAPSVVSLLDKEPSVTASAISPQNIIHVAPDPTPQPNVSSISTVEQRDAAYVRDSELGSRLRSEHQVPTCYELPNLDEALERARSFKGILFLLGLVACILLKTAYEVVGNAGDHGDASFCCQQTQSEKTRAELLAEQRDYKRRRKSYRAKVTHKTPIEIQRDIINAYMQDFQLLQEMEIKEERGA